MFFGLTGVMFLVHLLSPRFSSSGGGGTTDTLEWLEWAYYLSHVVGGTSARPRGILLAVMSVGSIAFFFAGVALAISQRPRFAWLNVLVPLGLVS